jgi:hypothetical protein
MKVRNVRKRLLFSVLSVLVFSFPQVSGAALISSEDFEGGSLGWSDNSTDNTEAAFTEFLGRFDGTSKNQSVYKTYSLPGDQISVIIEFDFYEIDSWDGSNESADDSFVVFINDSIVIDAQYAWWSDDDDTDPHSTPYAGPLNLGFTESFYDQRHHYVINVPSNATSIKLGFGSGLDQDMSDESWGIDNVTINTSYEQQSVPASNPIPTMSQWALIMLPMLLGLMVFANRRRIF